MNVTRCQTCPPDEELPRADAKFICSIVCVVNLVNEPERQWMSNVISVNRPIMNMFNLWVCYGARALTL